MSDFDVYGEPINPFITDSNYVDFNLTGASDYRNNLIEGYQTYFIGNTSPQDDNDPNTTNAVLLIINQEPSSDAVNSFDVGFYDLTFSASGYFTYYATASGVDPNVIRESGITQSAPQGYFPPISTYPTESFFRGWGESDYFETDEDGEVFRVGSGEGFSSDTLGNFNTGSYELDNDNKVPYKKSRYPWFMNARESTIMALSASRTVGLHDRTDLQLYTGSITASSVPIGPAFNIATPPVPQETEVDFDNNLPTYNTTYNVQGYAPGGYSNPCGDNSEPGFIAFSWGGGGQPEGIFGDSPTGLSSQYVEINLTTTDPTLTWEVIFTDDPDGTQNILTWGNFQGGGQGIITGGGNISALVFYPQPGNGLPIGEDPCPAENRVGYLRINWTSQGVQDSSGYYKITQYLYNGGFGNEQNP